MEAKIKSVTFYLSTTEFATFYILAERGDKFAKFVLKKKWKDAIQIFEHVGKHNFVINKERKPSDSYYKGGTIKMFHVLDIIPVEKADIEHSMEWTPFA